MAYVLPQVLVSQEFAAQPAAIDQPLPACIVGEHFELHRYSDANEKAGIYGGIYDPNSDQCVAWPSRKAGAVVDQTYTKVFLDSALLNYFNDLVGVDSTVKNGANTKNRVRSDSVVFKTANGVDRSADLLRDVQIGDVVKLSGTACGRVEELTTSVVGFDAEVVASSIDAATPAVSNVVTTAAATSHSKTGGYDNDIEIASVSGTSYNGLPDGNTSETYVVSVIAGGGAGEAILKVVSASGNDDVAATIFSDFGEAIAIGTRGLTATFDTNWHNGSSLAVVQGHPNDVFIVGQEWTIEVSQTFAAPVATSGGDYNGAVDTTYVVEVTRGGKYSSATKPLIKVTTVTGNDRSGPTAVTGASTDVAVGTRGVTIQFSGTGLSKGDRYYINANAETAGAIQTLILAHNLPHALRGICDEGEHSSSVPAPDLNLSLYIKKNIEVPELNSFDVANWTQSETELCLAASLTAFDATWVDSNGDLVPLNVTEGSIYIQHRDRLDTYAGIVGEAPQVSDVATLLGTVDPDNPLAFGVYKACENANGQPVKFTAVTGAVSTLTTADWLNGLEALVGRSDTYGLVPLTYDKDVQDAFAAHVDAESSKENGRWRVCWLNKQAVEVSPIYTVSAGNTLNPCVATIADDSDTSGTQYTYVEAPGEEFLTKGVRAGDLFRTHYNGSAYETYVIDRVFNEESLRLVSGPAAPVAVAMKFEIHRTLSKTDLANNLALNPGLFGDRRVRMVWPDVVGNAGVTFPGYFLCAGLAGLRSGVLPHQPLTNIEIKGFDDVSRTVNYFNALQLNTMAASGYWIVTQDTKTGVVYSRHQLTCGDQTDVNQREDSSVSNADHISYTFLFGLKDLVGKGNICPQMINMVRGEVIAIEQVFLNNIVVERLGPQLLQASLTELAQDAVYKDQLVARLEVNQPAPLNRLDLHIRFS